MIVTVVSFAAEVKDHPVDLINIAIEELVKERYELPTFNSLNRLVSHVCSITNNRLFQGLSGDEQAYLDQLLGGTSESIATLHLLKSLPKSVKLSHIKQLQTKFN